MNEDIMTVPYVVFEGEMTRMERINKRLAIALIICIIGFFATNAAWLWYESQFETYTYTQDGEGINNVNYGEQGALNNVSEVENQEEETR